MTVHDLYLRVMAAVQNAHPNVKADVDAAFAEHAAAQQQPAETTPETTTGEEGA